MTEPTNAEDANQRFAQAARLLISYCTDAGFNPKRTIWDLDHDLNPATDFEVAQAARLLISYCTDAGFNPKNVTMWDLDRTFNPPMGPEAAKPVRPTWLPDEEELRQAPRKEYRLVRDDDDPEGSGQGDGS